MIGSKTGSEKTVHIDEEASVRAQLAGFNISMRSTDEAITGIKFDRQVPVIDCSPDAQVGSSNWTTFSVDAKHGVVGL